MSKELDKVNEIYRTRAIYKADGTTVIESGWFNLLVTYAKKALQRLEAIDNVNLSEALIEIDKILGYFGGDEVQIETMTLVKSNVLKIKQALLKMQEPEKHLRWEDLEFEDEWKYQEVKLNGIKYIIKYKCDFDFFDNYYEIVKIYNQNERKQLFKLYNNKQFFNNLQLERVE